jgi:hypothetical protein
MYGSSEKKYPPRQAARALRLLMAVHQEPEETLIDYYTRFKSVVENAEETFGEIVPTAVATLIDDKEKKSKAAKEKDARERVLAVMFMDGGNKGYRQMMRDLENDYALRAALYLTVLEEAFQVMKVYEEQPLYKSILKNETTKSDKMKTDKKRPHKEPRDQDSTPKYGTSFLQNEVQEQLKREGRCYNCGARGHRAFECVNEKKKKQMVQYALVPEAKAVTKDMVYDFMK